MGKKRTVGVVWWGSLLQCGGIAYGILNAARNIWRWDLVLLPILYVVIGIGILGLKNWARLTFLTLMGLTMLAGVVGLPAHLQGIKELAKEGLFLPAVVAFIMRFAVGFAAIIFFNRPSVRAQFTTRDEV